MTMLTKRLLNTMLLVATTIPLGGAAWEACDGKPVRPAMKPIVLRPNGCSIGDLGSNVGRSVAILAREGAVHWTTHVLPPNPGDPCFITHNDGTWDVALVNPGVIDGQAGRTLELYEPCPNSVKHEADIMISVQQDFSQADQRRFITTGAVGMGRHAMLHEYGHALGLEHADDAFGIMRSSTGKGAPMGGHTTSGSPHYFMADDAFGLLQIGGIPKNYPNFYVTSQIVLPNAALRNADDNPANGARYADPLPVRTRQLLEISAGAGIHNWWDRTIALRAYADSTAECTTLDGVGTTLGVAIVKLSQFVTANGQMMLKIPPLGPSGQVLNVHLAGTIVSAPVPGGPEQRAWDDCAVTGLRIKTP